jgi:hypothetical protein
LCPPQDYVSAQAVRASRQRVDEAAAQARQRKLLRLGLVAPGGGGAPGGEPGPDAAARGLALRMAMARAVEQERCVGALNWHQPKRFLGFVVKFVSAGCAASASASPQLPLVIALC